MKQYKKNFLFGLEVGDESEIRSNRIGIKDSGDYRKYFLLSIEKWDHSRFKTQQSSLEVDISWWRRCFKLDYRSFGYARW